MERRKNPYTISKPQPLRPPTPTYQAPNSITGVTNTFTRPNGLKSTNDYHAPTSHQPTNVPRPLSDIRELSEPSIIDAVVHRINHSKERSCSAHKAASAASLKTTGSPRGLRAGRSRELFGSRHAAKAETSSSYSSTPEQSSFYTIPYSSVPRRSSSQTHAQRPARSHARKPSIRVAQPPGPVFEGLTVPNHGESHSPVKQAAARSNAVRSDAARKAPSRTYVRTSHAADILEFPSYRHPRLKLDLQVSAPLFVGGGSIEGMVHVIVDGNERTRSRRSLALRGLAVDLVGFEDMPNSRSAAFLAIGTELVDTGHPPPRNMTQPPNPLAAEDDCWPLTPSMSALPFMISLPLDTGPPPFQSKIANIRFLLAATALIIDAGKHYRVRTSQTVSVIATYDPEKALTSLTSPLTATDELCLPRFGRCESLKLTAGLHRQVWVSGSSIFVDVHIVNKTHKPVKRLELILERDILCYKHPPAGTNEKSASHARIFESNQQTVAARSMLKPGQQGWNGVPPHSSETRTCELELPRGHATVRCGKFFEVRFFLNIIASLANTKLVTVQLPIILIHMNSLDVVPNSVAQVAAAIEEKRIKTKRHGRSHSRQHSSSSPDAATEIRRRPSYSQGRAFAVPRQQSANRLRAMKSELADICQELDASPRKFAPEFQGAVLRKTGSNVNISGISIGRQGSFKQSGLNRDRYQTPPRTRSGKESSHSELRKAKSFTILPRMRSVDSMWSREPKRVDPVQDQNIKPQYHFSLPRKQTDGNLPSWTTSRGQPSRTSTADSIIRPGTGLGFRGRMDKTKAEFRGVRQKTSATLKERSMNWLDQVRNPDRAREGWI